MILMRMVILPSLNELLDLYIDVGRGEACYGMTLVEFSELFESKVKELNKNGISIGVGY